MRTIIEESHTSQQLPRLRIVLKIQEIYFDFKLMLKIPEFCFGFQVA